MRCCEAMSFFNRFISWEIKWSNRLFSGRRKWFTYIWLTVIGFILIFYIIGNEVTHGKPYAVATAYITHNACITEHLGEIKNTRLGFFSRFYTKDKKALFNLQVKGERSKGMVMVVLKRKNGSWVVTKALLKSIEGQWNC